ncbi:hypothetical protein E2C01_062739 [Portunus trituberculatus]|uniref:Uncharacterized protein n=1 Tax=Portunus trituberculatus TaxID=210409 RepID=A0A5B7HGW6_PORTR|nr:hypothetical protein [Portunus trituberculatus]
MAQEAWLVGHCVAPMRTEDRRVVRDLEGTSCTLGSSQKVNDRRRDSEVPDELTKCYANFVALPAPSCVPPPPVPGRSVSFSPLCVTELSESGCYSSRQPGLRERSARLSTPAAPRHPGKVLLPDTHRPNPKKIVRRPLTEEEAEGGLQHLVSGVGT